jgi:two-component system sensor histidine kinase MtrB
MTFRRSAVGRAVIRRLPVRVKRWLRIGRRWQRKAVARVKFRWHRSLQLRVVSTTLLLSVLVIAVLGFFLIQSVAAGLLTNAENAADSQVRNGRTAALGLSNVNVLDPGGPGDTADIVSVATTTARTLQQPSGSTGSYLVFIRLTDIIPAVVHWVGQSNVNITATIPPTLVDKVDGKQSPEMYDNNTTVAPLYEPTTLVYSSGTSVPALAVGVPLGRYYQLYYVFPFSQQQATLLLVQRILVGVGLALVALLAAIASLVTRWVVLPVRHAAQAAQRVSDGHLGERMQVRGVDDLAALATSFNGMARSLQRQLRELEDLSSVQRQFVSDVSHELRTPLATIKMAADVLFEARAELDAAAGRSVELLQSQLDRFESLLVDLLEISRATWCGARPTMRSSWPSGAAAGSSSGCPRRAASPRWTAAGWSASCATSWSTRSSTAKARTWWSPPPWTATRWPSQSATTAWACGRARTRRSSTGSGGPIRRAPAPSAAAGSGWPSPSRTPGCTAAGCRPGASAARVRCSG